MKVLVVGGGGREHALVWALHRSPGVETLRCAPGNAGSASLAEPVSIGADDTDALVQHAIAESYDLVVVGPEAPLVDGLADRLREAGVAVFGPSAAAAELEGSKVFAKRFMERHGLPTAGFRVFDTAGPATDYLRLADYPLVIKADGLAAGKGVVIVDDAEQAIEVARGMLEGRLHGDAGRRVLVEEMLQGREVSFFVLSDGENVVELATCQDYKRVGDADKGPNTGGMGCYSPSVYLEEDLRRRLLEDVAVPVIDGMRAEGRPYQGVLYVGAMLTDEGPKILEFNARFGDPETQALLPRLDGDWCELLHACAVGELGERQPKWRKQASVCVVMAAGGYPGDYARGSRIDGIRQAEDRGAVVFHAGTANGPDGTVVTTGGRVLGVTALGEDLADARRRAYDAVACIRWKDEHHRGDIAADALAQLDRG